jgi:predicted NAD-dependent protein-ADP-ribosyltransferase YbiA (DUF1768 family)
MLKQHFEPRGWPNEAIHCRIKKRNKEKIQINRNAYLIKCTQKEKRQNMLFSLKNQYDAETNKNQYGGGITAQPTAKNLIVKILWKNSRLEFLGSRRHPPH